MMGPVWGHGPQTDPHSQRLSQYHDDAPYFVTEKYWYSHNSWQGLSAAECLKDIRVRYFQAPIKLNLLPKRCVAVCPWLVQQGQSVEAGKVEAERVHLEAGRWRLGAVL